VYYYESIVKIYLKNDISFFRCNEFLSKNLFKVMLNNTSLKELHKKNSFKPYVFSLLYPPNQKTKIYEKNKEYEFTIRSIDEDFLKSLLMELQFHNGLDFSVLNVKLFRVKQYYIDSLHNISPAVLTLSSKEKNAYWRLDDGNILMVKDRIIANLEKKYKYFFNEQLNAPSDAIQYFEILNNTPYHTKYKQKTLLSNKFRIGFNSDEVSQKLAFTCMALGMLEKNSLGFGFCIAKKIKILNRLVR
jgi:CRISPR-associated endoribonuclease Cas6